ncbi:transposase [Bradyrhizobium sp. USDA 4529]
MALTYASAVDEPQRFRSSKATGAHFGLTPKKYQSGETDYTGRISKIGDASVREALNKAAHVMLTKPVRNCSALKSWAMRIARRAGMRKVRGRDPHHWAPPAQIPASPIKAPGSYLGCLTAKRSFGHG